MFFNAGAQDCSYEKRHKVCVCPDIIYCWVEIAAGHKLNFGIEIFKKIWIVK